jgi:hypothetical protein
VWRGGCSGTAFIGRRGKRRGCDEVVEASSSGGGRP